jgi:hypothetical protein
VVVISLTGLKAFVGPDRARGRKDDPEYGCIQGTATPNRVVLLV